MHIRNYKNEDFPSLIEILKTTGLYKEQYDLREDYQRQINHDPESIKVAELDERVVGGVFILYNPWASFIFHLCVDPENQRKGIGTKLIDTAENVLKRRGIKNPVIYLSNKGQQALGFYRQRGWEGDSFVIPITKDI